MAYDITLNGAPIATVATSSKSGNSFVTNDRYLDVECEPKDLDRVFLVAFSIARTDQAYYK